MYSFTVVENRKIFLKKLHTKKMDRVARRGSWRANVSQCRKTERGDPLRFFNIHSVAKHEKMQGKPFEEKKCRKKFRKKMSRSAEKIERGTLWSRPVWYVTRKNR